MELCDEYSAKSYFKYGQPIDSETDRYKYNIIAALSIISILNA